MQLTGKLWAVHLNSGATVYACDVHLTDALDEYALDDVPVGHAPCNTDADCQWC